MSQTNKGVLNDTVEADSQFKQITYNGIALIEHVPTKYINISKAFRDNGKRWYKYKQTQQWKEIEKVAENKFKTGCWKVGANSPPPQNDIYFDVDTGKNEFRGIYIHPKLVHFVCQYVSVDYAFKVAELMDSINDNVHIQLEKQQLADTPEHAEPIFKSVVRTYCQPVCEHYSCDEMNSRFPFDKEFDREDLSKYRTSGFNKESLRQYIKEYPYAVFGNPELKEACIKFKLIEVD